MWELYRGQTRRPRSQIREQEKPIKDWPGGEAKEVDVVGGVRKRGQAQWRKTSAVGESMFESIGNRIGSYFILRKKYISKGERCCKGGCWLMRGREREFK